MNIINLMLILIFSATLRFWKLGILPPINNHSDYALRTISALTSLGSIVIIYLLVNKLFRSLRLSHLSGFIFSLLPLSVVESRIVSEPGISLFFLLILAYLFIGTKNIYFKFSLLFLIPFILYFFYPHLWIFRSSRFNLNTSSLLNNFFAIISPDNLFFANNHFWRGGVRDYGMMYLSFMPFFLVGIYVLIANTGLLLLSGTVILLSIISPYFPESRELYFFLPILALIIAKGILKVRKYSNNIKAVAILVFFLLYFIYDFSGFLHFYSIHYPQVIKDYIPSLHEPF